MLIVALRGEAQPPVAPAPRFALPDESRPPVAPTPRQPAPGEGVVCALSIYTVVAEVAGRCFPGEDPELQAELRTSVARLDAYMLRNSKMTAADLARFKSKPGGAVPAAQLCRVSDAVEMYKVFRRQGPAALRASVDTAVARDGPPTWGTCL